MLNLNQWVNGESQPLYLQMQQAMFYPNAYLNFNQNGEYTKHYYNGSERIASRLGGNLLTMEAEADDRLLSRIAQVEERTRTELQELVSAGDDPVNLPDVDLTCLSPTYPLNDIYYYHMNHLGSTAFVSNQNQNVTQGFLYAPFGEITTEYNATFGNDIIPKYSFNAKELDEETGMYYYEARYYKPPVFTSRDAMFEKYFWMTPYAYCANNPVKYVDPSGEELGDPPYTGSGWGHNMRRFIANTFNVNSNINNVFEAGLNSILQSNNVNVTGQALDKIKKDPAMKSLEEKYLKSIQSDSRFGKEEFQMNYSNPIQFGGKRAPESMREQCKDPFNPKYKDTWKVAANELTWLVRSVTVKTVINVTKDGDITMNHSFKDKLDLRPSEGRSKEYNRVTSIMGFIYHDVLGGNDEMTVSASWSNSFPLKKPTNTSNR
jgi:RHS repeat-associated protein